MSKKEGTCLSIQITKCTLLLGAKAKSNLDEQHQTLFPYCNGNAHKDTTQIMCLRTIIEIKNKKGMYLRKSRP